MWLCIRLTQRAAYLLQTSTYNDINSSMCASLRNCAYTLLYLFVRPPLNQQLISLWSGAGCGLWCSAPARRRPCHRPVPAPSLHTRYSQPFHSSTESSLTNLRSLFSYSTLTMHQPSSLFVIFMKALISQEVSTCVPED